MQDRRAKWPERPQNNREQVGMLNEFKTFIARGNVLDLAVGIIIGAALSLSETGDPVEAASRLFHSLREADRLAGPGGAIAVAPIPEAGLGRAINDRLRRAAAPRT